MLCILFAFGALAELAMLAGYKKDIAQKKSIGKEVFSHG